MLNGYQSSKQAIVKMKRHKTVNNVQYKFGINSESKFLMDNIWIFLILLG